MREAICLELLTVTVISWVGIWGLVEEIIEPLKKKWQRIAAYSCLLGVAVLIATLQKTVSVCGLL